MVEDDVSTSVLDLYDALCAADIDRLALRFCVDGFSEFAGTGGGRLLQEDQTPEPPQTHRLSMILLWQDESWRMRHVHYSLVSPR